MSTVSVEGININIPLPGIQNDSSVMRNNFRIIKEALLALDEELANLDRRISIPPPTPTGIIGVQGPTGATGPYGLQGFDGRTGPQGVQGIQGIPGLQGEKGDQGDQGVTGPTGAQGPTGTPSFIQGPTGPKGLDITGPTGPGIALTPATRYSLGAVSVGSNINVTTQGRIDITGDNVIAALGYKPVAVTGDKVDLSNIDAKKLNGQVGGTGPYNYVQLDEFGRLPWLDARNLIIPERLKLFGLRPQRVDQWTLEISPGTCTDADVTTNMIIPPDTPAYVDIRVNGLGGLDTGTVQIGESYYVYIIKNPISKLVSAVLSKELSHITVTKPSGYTAIRKLPWGFVYTSNGIQPVHVSGWPAPFTRFTLADDTSSWQVLSSGVNSSWTAVSLAGFLPVNAKMAYVMCFAVGTSGNPNFSSARITTDPVNGSAGIPVGGKSSGNQGSLPIYVWIETNGNRQIYYKTLSGTMLDIYILGYMQSEIS